MGKDAVLDELVSNEGAKVAHGIWAHWMRYFFTQCDFDLGQTSGDVEYGAGVISSQQVERWMRLMDTEFDKLTEGEKKSDIEISNRYIRDLLIVTKQAYEGTI